MVSPHTHERRLAAARRRLMQAASGLDRIDQEPRRGDGKRLIHSPIWSAYMAAYRHYCETAQAAEESAGRPAESVAS